MTCIKSGNKQIEAKAYQGRIYKTRALVVNDEILVMKGSWRDKKRFDS